MKRFKVCALALIFLLCQRPVFAEMFDIPPGPLEQTLAAYKDATGQNLVYMNSLVTEKNSPGVKGDFSPKQAMDTILDGTGLSFELTAQGDMVLKKTVPSPSSTKKANTSIADPSLMSMEQIVVTATKTPIKAKEVPAAVGVVTSEDLKLRNRTDNFFEAVRTIPGIAESTSNSMGWPSLTIRGATPNILINGRDSKQFSGGSYTIDPGLMSMGAVERIEVLKGPQSAMYGGKAISGTINIITKKGDKKQPYVQVNSLYGSGKELAGSVSLSGGKDKLSYFINANGSTKSDWNTPEGKIPYVEREQQNFYGRFDYDFLPEHTISFEYMYNNASHKTGGKGYHHENVPDFYKKIWSIDPAIFHAAYLSYEGKLADWFSLYLTVGGGENDFDDHYGYNGFNEKTPLEDYLSGKNHSMRKNDFLFGEIRGTATLFSEDKLRIITGVQYKKSELDWTAKNAIPLLNFSILETESYVSPYVQAEFRPVDYLMLVSGVRYDAYNYDKSSNYSAINPRLAISLFPFVHTAYDWTSIWGSYSEAFNPPDAMQMQGPSFIGPNPDLKPEKTKGLEFGIKQRLSHWAMLEASYFDVDYDDMIRRFNHDPLNPAAGYFANVSKASLKGFELLCEFYPSDWLILHFGYTDLERRNEETGEKLTGQPNTIIQYGLTLNDLYGFSGSIWGRQYRDYKNASGIYKTMGTWDQPSEGKIIWDMKIVYKWNIREGLKCEPFFAVNNLSNETYYAGGDSCHLMEERTYQIGFSIKKDF